MKKHYVTEAEAQKMWELYQKLGTFKAVAQKMHRSPETVSRHVHRIEAAVGAVGYVLSAQNA